MDSTKIELADALNEQLIIKNKYKKAIKNAKAAANKERDELQQKIVQICTTVLEKFGPNAFCKNKAKIRAKKHKNYFQHFGKLSRKLFRKVNYHCYFLKSCDM